MRLICTLKRPPFLICVCLLLTQVSLAQVCSSPATVIYGMDDVGGIYPITSATGAVGARINPAYTGNAPSSSNAMGYNPGNGRFYYFKRNADQVRKNSFLSTRQPIHMLHSPVVQQLTTLRRVRSLLMESDITALMMLQISISIDSAPTSGN